MKIKEKYLPIGTVVLLKGGKKELMITSYCIFPTGKLMVDGKEKDPKGVMYEYGACTYPEGMIDGNTILGFNHEQIEKVCYMGYETEDQEGFSAALTQTLDELQEKIASGELQMQSEGQ